MPNPEPPPFAATPADVTFSEESSSTSALACRSIDNAPLHDGQVKLSFAEAMLLVVAMYSRTHERQYAAPQHVETTLSVGGSWH